MRGKPAAFGMDYLTCQSVAFADLLNNLIRAGGSQAGDDTHGQGGQGISGRKVRHVDVHGGHPQQAAKGTTDGRQTLICQLGLLDRGGGKVSYLHKIIFFVNIH